MQPTIRRVHPDDEYYFKEGCYILELSNAPDDPDVSVARARVRPGVSTRLHCLHGITERYLILEGRGRVDLDGQTAQPVGPGDMVIIPSRCAQRIANVGEADLVFLAICTPRFVSAAYEDIGDAARDV